MYDAQEFVRKDAIREQGPADALPREWKPKATRKSYVKKNPMKTKTFMVELLILSIKIILMSPLQKVRIWLLNE